MWGNFVMLTKWNVSNFSPDRPSDSQVEDSEEKRTRNAVDAPLDMTTRRRASSPKASSSPPRYPRSPPPYGAFHYTTSTTQQFQRPSVITCASGPKHCPKTSCPSPGYTGSTSPTRAQENSSGSQNSKEVRHGHRRELFSGKNTFTTNSVNTFRKWMASMWDKLVRKCANMKFICI